MLIYRCWIVYGRSWVVITVPVILAIAGLVVCIAFSIFLEVTLPHASQFASPYEQVVVSTWALTICINVIASPYEQVVVSTWALTICINVITTSLILFRIWRVDRMNAGILDQSTANGPYRHPKRIIIESGLLYTIVATVTASVYISGSNAFSPLTGIEVQMIGIAFNLILIRVYRNRAAELRPNNDRLPASSLQFVSPDASRPTETAFGDLESNHSLGRLEVQEPDSDASTAVSLQEKA